jgi:hypothetical protein
MNQRLGLALAVGGGYLLGRTKKARLAFGLGSMVLGKRLNVTPAALRTYVTDQLRGNPHLEQLGTELRKELGGAGKAAATALTKRQLNGIADRLHSRTSDLQDRLGKAVPGGGGAEEPDDAHEPADAEEEEQTARDSEGEGENEKDAKPARAARKTSAKSTGAAGKAAGGTARKSARKTADKAPARKTAAKTPARKSADKAPARKTAARKEAAGRGQSGRTAASSRSPRRSSSKREADRD